MAITRKRRSTGKVTIADVAQLAGVGKLSVWSNDPWLSSIQRPCLTGGATKVA